MDKIKLKLETPKPLTFGWQGYTIEVVPFLSASVQGGLILKYIKDLFSEGQGIIPDVEFKLLDAELSQMIYILNSHTNINVSGDEKSLFDEDLFFDSELWYKITEQIYNYKSFVERRDKIVNSILKQKESELSPGSTLESLIEQFKDAIMAISEINPEELEKLQGESKELIESLSESPLLEELIRHNS